MNKITVNIVGASGYGGGELLRILLSHPEVVIAQVTSQRFAGQSVSVVHPNLRSVTNLFFVKIEELQSCDLLFICLPNGESMSRMKTFLKLSKKIIDCGADFRLKNSADWNRWYKTPHALPGLLSDFVYGLPELHRKELQKAMLVAVPGCEAAVTTLSLYPLVQEKLIDSEKIIVDAKMSSSQAGNRGTDASHHPERSGSVRSYLPTGHRHTAEVEQELGLVSNKNNHVLISATAIEMVRGILVTIHTFLNREVTDKDIWHAYRKHYGDEPFIRLVKQRVGLYRYPEPKILQGTNFCDIGFELDAHSNRLVIIGAIDNLVKGTAGNAVQCMNLMCGFEEKLGLTFPGLHPI